MKISNKSNINFKALHNALYESNYKPELPNLVHTTSFFRYNDLDEFIINKLKKKQLAQNAPLNIISAGCSYGEEVYSYALALDDLAKKANIIGLDISKKVIDEARLGHFQLDEWENSYLSLDSQMPKFFEKSPFIHTMKEKFNENFECYNPKTHEYRKKEGKLENCSFVSGNILNLSQNVEKNSQDLILCRYVLYQLDKKDLDAFFKQAFDALKPGGLLCVEPFGYPKYQSKIIQAGFIQPYNEAPCVFKKPKNLQNMANYYKQMIVRPEFCTKLDNKPEFDDVPQRFEENLFVHF
ncbi:MAG: methyltransferase domain-containing protein [Candidatus Gastranaerophilales bacterium]|nr:methyltransferase domain-containing protein [Candidatus Gastranaerophilales bacterium]